METDQRIISKFLIARVAALVIAGACFLPSKGGECAHAASSVACSDRLKERLQLLGSLGPSGHLDLAWQLKQADPARRKALLKVIGRFNPEKGMTAEGARRYLEDLYQAVHGSPFALRESWPDRKSVV